MAESDKTDEKNQQSTPGQTAPVKQGVRKEYGGPKGPEPTRYGDWEKNGRCIDF